MKLDFHALSESPLFAGIPEEDLQRLLACVSPKEKKYKRGSIIFCAGDDVRFVYYILSGSVHIINEDFWGNSSIVETMESDTLFGEAYVFSSTQQHLVSVVAAEDLRVFEINPSSLFSTCSKECSQHSQLVQNALFITSEKIVRLTEKLLHIMQRTLREKLLSYLTKCAQKEKSTSFYIPYSRQELADYLCVDRSALSHELSRLQKTGMILYRKNYFELLDVKEH